MIIFFALFLTEKPLLMLQSLKRMLKVDASDPQVHGCLIRFQNFVEVNSKGFAGAVNQVIDQETQSIFTTKSARERNEQFIQSHSKTLDHRLVGKLSTTFFTIFFRLSHSAVGSFFSVKSARKFKN